MRHIALLIDDDMHFFLTVPHGTSHANRRAKGIHVAHLVPHNHNLRRISNELNQGICHNARLDLGALFHFLGQSAEKVKVIAGLDDRLVTAPRQRHIQRHTCVAPVFLIAFALFADTDG